MVRQQMKGKNVYSPFIYYVKKQLSFFIILKVLIFFIGAMQLKHLINFEEIKFKLKINDQGNNNF